MGDNSLNRDDFILLMNSYKTQVELNTKLLDEQQHILSKMNIILDMQRKTCETIDNHTVVYNDGVNRLVDILSQQSKDNIVEHSKIKHQIYISLVGMSTIIITLLALLFK